MLSKLGFVVEQANDGLDALNKLKKFHPNLILLDNIMPKMSGWELTKTLKSDSKFQDIPIIMFSALDDVKDTTVYTRQGDFLAVVFVLAALLLLLIGGVLCIMRKIVKRRYI